MTDNQIYIEFADALQKKFMKIRYGIKGPLSDWDIDRAWIKKELANHRKNDDCKFTQIASDYSDYLLNPAEIPPADCECP